MKNNFLFTLGAALALTGAARAVDVKPNLKVLICTGDYGHSAQERVPMIEAAVEKSAPNSHVFWEAHQSYNFTKILENPGYAQQFDTIVIGDIAIGQLTSKAQTNLVSFVRNGGGLVWVMWAKSTIPFQGSEEAVPMPLKTTLPVAYPDFSKPAEGAKTLASTDNFWQGVDFSALTEENARKPLDHFLIENSAGKGRVLALYGAFGPSFKRKAYATYETVPGGWADFPDLGEVWTRVLNEAAQASPVRAQSSAAVAARTKDVPLQVTVNVDGTQTVDQIRAADFSIVALQQLYNEDGGKNEALFLALNPRDWFDRRTQEVLPVTSGTKKDKPAFFRDYNIKGIYMGENSYGSYGNWNDAKYQEQIDKAVAAQKKYPGIIPFFQAGNEPPLDANYLKFHQKFVGGVLAQAPNYKVVGPNKAFNLLGVNPKEMDFYLDNAGKTTDILNWHTYAQPPATIVAEANYWSQRADGKMRVPGPAKVMFTESDAWNQGASQFNYLMERALTFLPDKTIIANFQYCMDPRSEGGTYKFGVLQPEGTFEANYNGYWAWRNLRGQMTATKVSADLGQYQKDQDASLTSFIAREKDRHVQAISSRSDDGKTFTTVVYYDGGYFNCSDFKSSLQFGGDRTIRIAEKASLAQVTVAPKLPDGDYKLEISDIKWDSRATRQAADAKAPIKVELAPYSAVALTWTKP